MFFSSPPFGVDVACFCLVMAVPSPVLRVGKETRDSIVLEGFSGGFGNISTSSMYRSGLVRSLRRALMASLRLRSEAIFLEHSDVEESMGLVPF